MANSSMVPGQSFHVRSISLPTRSHPIVIKIEEELQNLKTCYDLKGLREMYSCIHEFLNLPSTQQSFSSCIEKKWLENELEGSIRLLELCGGIKDMLSVVEEHVQDLRFASRKKGDSAASEEEIREQVFSKKEIRNNIKNCQNLLKRVERMCETFPCIDKSTQDLSSASRILIEARETTISHLRSVLSSMPGPKSNVRLWSFVSKAMNMKKVASHGEYENSRVFVDNICFKDVEAGLECLFRRLIQTRVSLLNILSQ